MLSDNNQDALYSHRRCRKLSGWYSTTKVSAVKPKAAAEAYEGMSSLSVSWTVDSVERKTAAADVMVSTNVDVSGTSRKESKRPELSHNGRQDHKPLRQ